MTDAPPPPQNPQGAAPQQAPNAPLIMHGQYIKDLSFENPRAPQSLIATRYAAKGDDDAPDGRCAAHCWLS